MKQLLLLIFILSISSCCSQKDVELPFLMDGHIYVLVTIEGKEHRFMFDTGSERTILSPKIIKTLNVQVMDTCILRFLMKKTDLVCPIYAPIEFKFGKLSVKSKFSSLPDREINIIGMDIISQLHWDFNFRTFRLKISREAIPMDEQDSIRIVLPYTLAPTMVTTIRLGKSFHGDFTFDTGLPSEGIHEDFVFYSTSYPDSLEHRLMAETPPFSAFYSSQYRQMILTQSHINDTHFNYPAILFAIDTSYKKFENFHVALPFVFNRFRVLHINPEKQEIVLAKKEGECLEYEQRKKERFDSMIKMAQEEQKQTSAK